MFGAPLNLTGKTGQLLLYLPYSTKKMSGKETPEEYNYDKDIRLLLVCWLDIHGLKA